MWSYNNMHMVVIMKKIFLILVFLFATVPSMAQTLDMRIYNNNAVVGNFILDTNASCIKQKNAAGDASPCLISLDASNNLVLGADGITAITPFNYLNNPVFRGATTIENGGGTPVTVFTNTGEASFAGVLGDNKAVCVKADDNLGTCADAVGAGGTCTCE